MAYEIPRRKNNLYQSGVEIEAVLDSAADLTALGNTDDTGNYYCPGSIAIVADSGAPMYMLNASHAWKEI